jgi:CelD/BcsL family acetyltransferase involved in cellulose biosynthesis
MAPLQTATTTHTLTLMTPETALADARVREKWESLMDLAHPLHRVFASPTLYEHQCTIEPRPENRVAVIRDDEGNVVGICPIVLWQLTMQFAAGKRLVARIMVKAATVLSCDPLVPPDPDLYRLLFRGLLDQLPWCDCVYLDSIALDSFPCKYLYSTEDRSRHYLLYPRRVKAREWIYMETGPSADSFLKEKQRRTRNTLKRRVKKLSEYGAGSLECRRVDAEAEVDEFYESALAIARESWQFHNLGRSLDETALCRANLHNLARIGCLRAYLLQCGGKPCAFVIGYQYQDILQFEQTAYTPEFANLSPGTVLYYLMLEDLYRHRPPSFVNHGIGVTPHKRLFSNRTLHDTTVYLFRPSMRNRLRCLSHGLWCSSIELAKRILRRRAGQQVDDSQIDA